MAKKKTTINCGDWHLSWRGTVGKLTLLDNGDFEWVGRWQGRHGQIGPKGECTFSYKDNEFILVSESGTKTNTKVLIECAIELLTQK